jgi:hypothetical protein
MRTKWFRLVEVGGAHDIGELMRVTSTAINTHRPPDPKATNPKLAPFRWYKPRILYHPMGYLSIHVNASAV